MRESDTSHAGSRDIEMEHVYVRHPEAEMVGKVHAGFKRSLLDGRKSRPLVNSFLCPIDR